MEKVIKTVRATNVSFFRSGRMRKSALIILSFLLTTGAFAQQTFDGWIKNNSLAISPDEKIALASMAQLFAYHP